MAGREHMLGRAGVFADKDFGSEVKGFSSLSVHIQRVSRIIGAPVETGVTSFDNKVIDPVKVTVKGVIETHGGIRNRDPLSALRKLQEMFDNRTTKFYSATDGIQYVNNLIMEQLPTTRDAEKYDFINVEAVFVQPILIQKQSGGSATPKSASNQSSANHGRGVGITVKAR